MTSTVNQRDGNKNNSAGTCAIATTTTLPEGSPNSDGIKIRSCLAGPDNPKTILRKQLDESGNPNVLHFDEKVVVHTAPFWDACDAMNPYFEDDETDESRGCCTIM